MAGNLVELSFLQSITIELVVELGRTQMTVRELSNLEKDDVIELNRQVSQPLIIRTGDIAIAEGEVFLEGDRVCLRVTQILNGAAPRAVAESA